METLRQFIAELRIADIKGDPWAVSMGAFFECAAHLYEKGDCPREWQYKPGWAGNTLDEESEFYSLFMEADESLLKEIGEFLFRYTNLLQRHGKSY